MWYPDIIAAALAVMMQITVTLLHADQIKRVAGCISHLITDPQEGVNSHHCHSATTGSHMGTAAKQNKADAAQERAVDTVDRSEIVSLIPSAYMEAARQAASTSQSRPVLMSQAQCKDSKHRAEA
jgi:hypothetical protein